MPVVAGQRARASFALLCGTLLATGAAAQQPAFGPGDPLVRDPARFDPRRPVARELALHVPDGFDVAVVGDLIISRPLSQYAPRLPGFRAVLDRLQHTDATVGNLETTIFDPRSFDGAPYSWDGDWSNASLPGVARDLRTMGFAMVGRANNHVLDWGLEGMRETSRWLDDAGIAYAGVGETHGLARAPQYYEGARGRVALVSIASTFRPTSESLPPSGAAPGRPGLSALHVTPVAELPAKQVQELHDVQCALRGGTCGPAPASGELFGMKYRQATHASVQHLVDDEDRAEIMRAIRVAKQNADLVVVLIHSHECSQGCDDDNAPRGPGEFLKQLAHEAIDSGADIFATTGNHNLGPIEIYHSPARGNRAIFYGLGNFFWSDVQELLPHDLFQGNRALLAESWQHPERATEYDLTAPLNAATFAHDYTFQSVIAECQFEGGQLARIELRAIEEGYGAPLTESGIPRMVTDPAAAAAIYRQVTDRTAAFGLPALNLAQSGSTATIRP
jgi:poly-gamma-glutamate capsule biosynthesis protein CapA/YwtB (metallophosphatase superfamily)